MEKSNIRNIEGRNEQILNAIKVTLEQFSYETNASFQRQHIELCSLLANGFLHDENTEIENVDLATIIIEFNKFLYKFNDYIAVEHYFFNTTSYSLKEMLLHSSIYINMEELKQNQIESKWEKVNNSLFLIKDTFIMIVDKISDGVDDLKKILTEYEYFSDYKDSDSITISLIQDNDNNFYFLKVTTQPFKKYSSKSIMKFIALKELEKRMGYGWEIRRKYSSKFINKVCTVSFIKPF